MLDPIQYEIFRHGFGIGINEFLVIDILSYHHVSHGYRHRRIGTGVDRYPALTGVNNVLGGPFLGAYQGMHLEVLLLAALVIIVGTEFLVFLLKVMSLFLYSKNFFHLLVPLLSCRKASINFV